MKRTPVGELMVLLEQIGDSSALPVECREMCAEIFSKIETPKVTFWGEEHAEELVEQLRKRVMHPTPQVQIGTA